MFWSPHTEQENIAKETKQRNPSVWRDVQINVSFPLEITVVYKVSISLKLDWVQSDEVTCAYY